MTPRDILLAFKDGQLSKREVREKLRALQKPPQRQPLSEAQQGLWVLEKMAPEMSTYHVPICCRIGNGLHVSLLQQACRQLLERYPILTTVFGEEDGTPFQSEQASQLLAFEQEDISTLASDAVLPHLWSRASKPFSLEQGPLMRVHLFTRATAAGVEYLLLMTLHHIIFDGTSIVPLVTTLFDIYRDLVAGREPEPSVPAAPYADFVAWEQRMLAGDSGAAHLAYWSRQLAGPLPILALPADRPRRQLGKAGADPAQSRRLEAHIVSERLSPELTQELRAFAEVHDMNFSTIFLGIFCLLLHRYTGQEEVLVGMPTIGRPQEQFDAAVGHFVNMIAIRAHTVSTRTFAEFLGELQLTVVDGLDHAAYPFPTLVRELNPPRHEEHSPIFQVAFAYQSVLRSEGLQEILRRYRDILAIEPVAELNKESVYELQLEIYERDVGCDVNIRYRSEVFYAATIERMMGHLVTLAAGVIRQPQLALSAYRLLTPADLRAPSPSDTECPGCHARYAIVDLCRTRHAQHASGALPAAAGGKTRQPGGAQHGPVAGDGRGDPGHPQGRWGLCAAGSSLPPRAFRIHDTR
jgi:polyketide synthase PksN